MSQRDIIFSVHESPEGGYEARAIGHSIFTQADTLEELNANLQDAVKCHFGDESEPRAVRVVKAEKARIFGSANGDFTVPDDFDAVDPEIEKLFYEGDPSGKDPVG